jgi:hypothetical protein
LEDFLEKSGVREEFNALNEDQYDVVIHRFTEFLIEQLKANRLLPCCVLYRLYHRLPNFEDKVLLPKLLSSDQIYTPVVISLLKQFPELKSKLLEQIDPAKALTILEHSQEDPRDYPAIHGFL